MFDARAAALLLSLLSASACGGDSKMSLEPQAPIILAGSSAPAAVSGGASGVPLAGRAAPAAPAAGSTAPAGPTTGSVGASTSVTGSCCEAQPRAGCGEPDVQQCVCAKVPSCCQTGWDIVCAQLVEDLACGNCQQPCCEAGSGPGCSDATVQSCVCGADPSCCSSGWDEFCVTLVDSLGCGGC